MMSDTGDSDVRAQVVGRIDRCPSGSYTYAFEAGGEDVEPDLPLAVAVTTEEHALAGALWITGGIPVERSDGQPLRRATASRSAAVATRRSSPCATARTARSTSASDCTSGLGSPRSRSRRVAINACTPGPAIIRHTALTHRDKMALDVVSQEACTPRPRTVGGPDAVRRGAPGLTISLPGE